jgi:hypothetical protein
MFNKFKFNRTGKTTQAAASEKVIKTTPVRNSPVPRPIGTVARKEVTHGMISKRAYEISLGNQCGDELHNWLSAERELKGL